MKIYKPQLKITGGKFHRLTQIKKSPEEIKKHRRCGRLVALGFSPGYTCDRQKPPMQSVDQRDGVPVGEKDQMLFNENL